MTDGTGRRHVPACRAAPDAAVPRLAAERAILQARVAVLERAIEHRDARLNTVVEQYEEILDRRAESPPAPPARIRDREQDRGDRRGEGGGSASDGALARIGRVLRSVLGR